MASLFDFARSARLFASGFTHAVRRHARRDRPLCHGDPRGRARAPPGRCVNGAPQPDFGGHHPDPNLVHAKDALRPDDVAERAGFRCGLRRRRRPQPDHRPRHLRHPSDSLALLAANAHLAPGYQDGIEGIARSMPTSRAADRVAASSAMHATRPHRLEVLRQPARCRDGDHLRRGECRDRLEPCAREGRAVGGAPLAQYPGGPQAAGDEIVREHWRDYGRNYYSRHDYEEVDAAAANGLMEHLRSQLAVLPGRILPAGTVDNADDFTYTDPVDGSVSKEPGYSHPVHRRLADRVPAVGHRHGRGHAAGLSGAVRARPEAPRPGDAENTRRPDQHG